MSSETAITDYLKGLGLLPADVAGNVPEYPDWDTPAWAQAQSSAPGLYRNDKFNFFYQQGNKKSYPLSQDSTYNAYWGSHVNYPLWIDTDGYGREAGAMAMIVRKRIDLDRTNVTTWMKDYHVRLSLVNCALADSDAHFNNHSKNADQANWMNPHGLYIEKYTDHFNIVCAWNNGDPFRGTSENGPGSYDNVGSSPKQRRGNTQWSRVFVTSEDSMHPQTNTNRTADWLNMGTDPMFRGEWCTYPTIYFEVIGYPQTYVNNIIKLWQILLLAGYRTLVICLLGMAPQGVMGTVDL